MQIVNQYGLNLLDFLPTGWIGVSDVYKYITVDSTGIIIAHRERPVNGMSDNCVGLAAIEKRGSIKHVWKRGFELNSVGDVILAIRAHKDLTQMEFAKLVGVTQSYVAQVERSSMLGSLRFARLASAACEIGIKISIKRDKVVFSLQPY